MRKEKILDLLSTLSFSDSRFHVRVRNTLSTIAFVAIFCLTMYIDFPETVVNLYQYNAHQANIEHNLSQVPLVPKELLHQSQINSLEMRMACFLCETKSRQRLCLFIKSASNIMRDTLMYTPVIFAVITNNYAIYRNYALTLTSLMTSVGLAKILIHKERPDGSNYQSFPSGHASESFVSAIFMLTRCGLLAGIPMFMMATITSLARIYCQKHTWIDIIAGAILGTICAIYAHRIWNHIVTIMRSKRINHD